MEGLFGAITTETTYSQELQAAVAAAAALATMLIVVILIIRAVYLITRLFTASAGYITTVVVTSAVLIGVLNR